MSLEGREEYILRVLATDDADAVFLPDRLVIAQHDRISVRWSRALSLTKIAMQSVNPEAADATRPGKVLREAVVSVLETRH